MKTCAEPELPLHFESDEGIQPMTQATAADTPSPLEQYAGTIILMAQNRTLLEGIRPNDHNWIALLQDMAMLVDESVTLGLRSPWARRVAVPVFYAWKALQNENVEPEIRAASAIDILSQCSDRRVLTICTTWLKAKFNV